MSPKPNRGGQKRGPKRYNTSVTKKLGYDNTIDLKKGICGYAGCKKTLAAATDNNPRPIGCDAHEEVHEVGYSYMPEGECQKKYNAEVEFSESVDNSFNVVHNSEDKTCKEGQVGKVTEHFQEAGRTYGAWDLKEPMELQPRLMQHV